MSVIFSAASGIPSPPSSASLLGWLALGAAVGAALVGSSRALVCWRWRESYYTHVGAWALGGAGVGAVVGLVVAMLRWASHESRATGIGAGTLLLLLVAGVAAFVAWMVRSGR
jgi:hypothetical protein